MSLKLEQLKRVSFVRGFLGYRLNSPIIKETILKSKLWEQKKDELRKQNGITPKKKR